MNKAEAEQLAGALQKMHDELTSIRGWLLGQTLERGLMRLPTQAMRATHQLDEMLLSVRKFAADPANAPWWQARGYSSYEEAMAAEHPAPEPYHPADHEEGTLPS